MAFGIGIYFESKFGFALSLARHELRWIVSYFPLASVNFFLTGPAKPAASTENALFSTRKANALLKPVELEPEDIAI
jgi:hypothetical protein